MNIFFDINSKKKRFFDAPFERPALARQPGGGKNLNSIQIFFSS